MISGELRQELDNAAKATSDQFAALSNLSKKVEGLTTAVQGLTAVTEQLRRVTEKRARGTADADDDKRREKRAKRPETKTAPQKATGEAGPANSLRTTSQPPPMPPCMTGTACATC